MKYCTTADLLFADPKLGDEVVAIPYEQVIEQAEAAVRVDLGHVVDIAWIEAEGILPQQLAMLAISKAKELAYRIYYGPMAPERSEIDRHRQDYVSRLDEVRRAVRNGELTSRLQAPASKQDSARMVRIL